MHRPPSVLSVCYEESLRHTRAWVLETAGFKVTSALGLSQAATHLQKNIFDLVMIGHSIPHADMESLFKMVKSHNHRARVLLLRGPGDPILSAADYSLDAWEGPEALISTIKKALKLK